MILKSETVLFPGIRGMKRNRVDSNLVIIVGGQKVLADRVVLASVSDFMKKLFINARDEDVTSLVIDFLLKVEFIR
jgi:hypothetical protein